MSGPNQARQQQAMPKFGNLTDTSYKLVWNNWHNDSWVSQNCDRAVTRQGTQELFDMLIAQKVGPDCRILIACP